MRLSRVESKEVINKNEKKYRKKIKWYSNRYISL